MCYLNNSFRCLNNTTHIFTTLFHSHVFPQHLKNVIRTTLPNGLLLILVSIYIFLYSFCCSLHFYPTSKHIKTKYFYMTLDAMLFWGLTGIHLTLLGGMYISRKLKSVIVFWKSVCSVFYFVYIFVVVF